MAAPTPLIHEMAASIASGQSVFFVGAGLSSMAGAPTWNDLVRPLRDALDPPSDESNPMLLAQYFVNEKGANALHRHLRDRLSPQTLRPTPAHEALCKMPASVYVTTNYDDLLERQLRALNRPTHVVLDEKGLALWTESREVQVLKLHGDLDHAESIVLTDWDYFRFLREKSLMKRKLAELFCYRTVIFIGYSLRDPNVSFIFNEISYQLGNLKRPAYIITFESDRHQHAEWKRRGVTPVCLSIERGLSRELRTERMTALLTNMLDQLHREVLATNRSIMIVDDDPAIVEMLKAHLRQAISGASVCSALDGHAAMYAIGTVRPRLLIVDVSMPKLNGWELLRMIRQFPELDALKVVVLSGNPHAYDPELCRTLRVSSFLEKGSGPDELINTVCELLDVRSRATKTHREPSASRTPNRTAGPGASTFPPPLAAASGERGDPFVRSQLPTIPKNAEHSAISVFPPPRAAADAEQGAPVVVSADPAKLPIR